MSTTVTRTYDQYREASEWPYDVVPVNPEESDDDSASVVMAGKEIQFTAEDGGVYAGAYTRAMINGGRAGMDPDAEDPPVWLGQATRDGSDVPILARELYRHVFEGGQTGAGKSNELTNILLQIALRGEGFAVVDPGGDIIKRLGKCLPDDLLEKTIFAEPVDQVRDRVIGFNYLDTLHKPGEPGYIEETESIVGDLMPMLSADFPKMKGVAENMVRALIRADHEDEYSYTIIDLYYMLLDEDSREEYAHMVEEERLTFLAPYAKKIADMADDELEPLLRRLKSWSENPLMRQLVAQRNSKISIAEVIRDDKILLVDAEIGSEDMRKRITTAVQRKIWSAVMSRKSDDEKIMLEEAGVEVPDIAGTEEGGDFDPYYLAIDEAHAVFDDAMNIEETLAMARSKRLGLILLTQQLNQLTPEKQKAIRNNCATFIAFNPGKDPDEKRALAQGFRNKSPDDLMVDRYHATTAITDAGGSMSDGFEIRAIPPYPPLRGIREVARLKAESYEEWGVPRPSDTEQISEIPERFRGDASAALPADETPVEDRVGPEEYALIAKAAYDEAIHSASDDGFVRATSERFEARVQRYVPDRVSYGSEIAGLLQATPDALLEDETRDGETYVRCTHDGKNHPDEGFIAQGTAASAGKINHWKLLVHGYAWLTRLGLEVELPEQVGARDVDGIARLREVWDPDATGRAAVDSYEAFAAEYPALDALTDGRDSTLEAECGTSKSPGQTVVNVAKAYESDEKCLLLVRREAAERVYNALAPPHPFQPAEHRFYTLGKLTLSGADPEQERPAYEGRRARWWYDAEHDEYVLSNERDEEQARFPDAASIWTDGYRYPETGSGEFVSDREGWTTVNEPVIPERVFGVPEASLPTPAEWDVVIVPPFDAEADADTDPAAALEVFRDGNAVTLAECASDGVTTVAPDPAPPGADDDAGATAEQTGGDSTEVQSANTPDSSGVEALREKYSE